MTTQQIIKCWENGVEPYHYDSGLKYWRSTIALGIVTGLLWLSVLKGWW